MPFVNADFIDKSAATHRNYITNRLITPMLRSGKLTMSIPNKTHHPEQKYPTGVPSME